MVPGNLGPHGLRGVGPHRLIEAPAEEMRSADHLKWRANAGAGTEAQRGLDMLDRDIELSGPHPEGTADVPSAREARVER